MPKIYGEDVKIILNKVKEFFEMEKEDGKPILLQNVLMRMELATGICHKTLKKLCASPATSENIKGRKSREITFDDFDREAIIRKVHQFYQRKEFPTLDKLLAQVRRDLGFTGGRTTLWKFLKKNGFKIKKQNGRNFLIQKPEVAFLRHQYLRKIHKLRQNKPQSKIIYLDETWINANHTPSRIWVDKDDKGGFRVPLGKGKRLIIAHAGSCEGFVPEAKLNFVSKKTSDYHDEMNGKHFEEWLETKVFPNIPEESVIVMDNASYHSVKEEKVPTKSNNKTELEAWLTKHNVTFSSTAKKDDLLRLVAAKKPTTPKYKIDELAKKYGHEIVRLPPYHPDLNPIELIWSQIKSYVARNNKDFNITGVQKLFEESLEHITEERWMKAIRHVVDIEQTYWEKDNIRDIEINDILIKLGEDSDSSDSDSGSDEEC